MDLRDVRPRSVGEVVDAGISLYRRRFATATVLSALFIIPTALVQVWNVRNSAASGLGDVLIGAFELAATTEPPPFSWVNVALDIIGTVGALAASVALFVPLYRGTSTGIKAALVHTSRRMLPILVFAFAFLVGGLVGLVLVLFPGLWLMTSWSLAIPAIIDEGVGARTAMNRSFHLVRGRFFTVAGILGLTLLIQGVLSYIGILATLAAEWLMSVSASFLITDALVNAVASLFGVPLLAAVLTAAYFDARTRREGIDIAAAAELLEAPSNGKGPADTDRDLFGLGGP
jgi:hypothetical protein